jgi:hypothetical protein
LGANRGKAGELPLQEDSTKPRIHEALLALGKDDKTLTASAIRKYDALLDAPEILRRAGPNADPDTRARNVEQMLRAHVRGITYELRQLVAQAALCTEQQYVGLQVWQREELLEELPMEIKTDTFKYHRKIVFKNIEAELTYEPSLGPAAPGHALTATQPMPMSTDTLVLVKAAADLHYALLTSMFLTWASGAVPVDESLPKYMLFAHIECAREAFGAFGSFVRAYHSRIILPAYRDELADHLSADAIDKLTFLLRTTWTCSPCAARKTLEELGPLFGFMPNLDGVHVMPDDEDVFEAWCRWFNDDASKLPAVARLEPLAAKAGAAVVIIAEHGDFNGPVFSDARRTAHKTLAYHFDLDELAPMFDGRSLHQLADAYFDTISPRLANSDLVWHDSESK